MRFIDLGDLDGIEDAQNADEPEENYNRTCPLFGRGAPGGKNQPKNTNETNAALKCWCSHGESNPGFRRERATS